MKTYFAFLIFIYTPKQPKQMIKIKIISYIKFIFSFFIFQASLSYSALAKHLVDEVFYCPQCNYSSKIPGSCPKDDSLLLSDKIYYCPYHLSQNQKEYDGSLSNQTGQCLNCKRAFLQIRKTEDKEWGKYVSMKDSFTVEAPGKPDIKNSIYQVKKNEILFHDYVWKSYIELNDNISYQISIGDLPKNIYDTEFDLFLSALSKAIIEKTEEELYSDISIQKEKYPSRKIHLISADGFVSKRIQIWIMNKKIYKQEVKTFKHKDHNENISAFYQTFSQLK